MKGKKKKKKAAAEEEPKVEPKAPGELLLLAPLRTLPQMCSLHSGTFNQIKFCLATTPRAVLRG
jgi:hypothetical protein